MTNERRGTLWLAFNVRNNADDERVLRDPSQLITSDGENIGKWLAEKVNEMLRAGETGDKKR